MPQKSLLDPASVRECSRHVVHLIFNACVGVWLVVKDDCGQHFTLKFLEDLLQGLKKHATSSKKCPLLLVAFLFLVVMPGATSSDAPRYQLHVQDLS